MAGPFDSIFGPPAAPAPAPTGGTAHYSSGGPFDALFGPPAALRAQREQQSYTAGKEAAALGRDRGANAAMTKALQELNTLRTATPNAPPNALLTQFLSSPAGIEVMNNKDVPWQEFLGKASAAISAPLMEVNDGSIYGRMDDTGNFNEVTRGMPKTPLVNVGRIGEDAQKKWNDEATKRYGELEEQQISTRKLAAMADRIDDQINAADGRDVVGLVGAAAGTVDVLATQARAAARELGVPMDPNAYPEYFGGTDATGKAVPGKFKSLSNQQAATKSNLTALAFIIARANNKGGPVTKADVQAAFEQIGGNWTTPGRIKAALGEIVNNALDDADANLEMSGPRFRGSDIQPPPELRGQLERSGVGARWMRPRKGSADPGGSTGPRAKGTVGAGGAAGDGTADISPEDINGLTDDELFNTKQDGTVKSVIDPRTLTTREAKEAYLTRLKQYRSKRAGAGSK